MSCLNVTLGSKVVRVGGISTVGAKQLKLAETTFADSTGSIVVDIWEQHIPMIENGKVYLFVEIFAHLLKALTKLFERFGKAFRKLTLSIKTFL